MRAPRTLGPVAAVALVFCAGIGTAHAGTSSNALPETMGMLKHAISIPTVEGQHQVPVLAAYLADKLKAGGFADSDVEIIPVGETAALVARYRGTGEGKPILLSGHMDVVAAHRKDWTRDPIRDDIGLAWLDHACRCVVSSREWHSLPPQELPPHSPARGLPSVAALSPALQRGEGEQKAHFSSTLRPLLQQRFPHAFVPSPHHSSLAAHHPSLGGCIGCTARQTWHADRKSAMNRRCDTQAPHRNMYATVF